MYIDMIKYIARGMAASNDDIVTFYIYFYRNGNLVDMAMVSGHSLLINDSLYPIAPVQADSMVIEAVDLDFDSHLLVINGVEYPVPKTGSKPIFFETPSLATQPILEAIAEKPESIIAYETIQEYDLPAAVAAGPAAETFHYSEPVPVATEEPVAAAPMGAVAEVEPGVKPKVSWTPLILLGLGIAILGSRKGSKN